MDSLSQLALGAAVGVAVMGRRVPVARAAAWGAVAGTLPDLDVLVPHGDPVRDMVLHRAETHALFWLALAALPLGWAVARLHREPQLRGRWILAWALALLTHPLLDAMTVYGTRLALPFSDRPYGVGSIFIIDPLYTLPLLIGLGIALARRHAGPGGLRANALGLLLSTAYLGGSVLIQQHITATARAALAAQGLRPQQLLVTPTPFNTVLWRVVAVEGAHYHEGFIGLLDGDRPVRFDRFERGTALLPAVQALEPVQRLSAFSHGFWKLEQAGDTLRITDLRMGQEPRYIFSFAVARLDAAARAQPLSPSRAVGARPDPSLALRWLLPRLRGADLPPPR